MRTQTDCKRLFGGLTGLFYGQTGLFCGRRHTDIPACFWTQMEPPLIFFRDGTPSLLYDIATHCNTLQHTATHCNTLHTHYHTLTCNTLQHTTTRNCRPLLRIGVCVLWCVAVRCMSVCGSVYVAVCVWQCVWGSVCVAVCVWQCVCAHIAKERGSAISLVGCLIFVGRFPQKSHQ